MPVDNPYLHALRSLVSELLPELEGPHTPVELKVLQRTLRSIPSVCEEATRFARLDELDHLDLGMIRYASEYHPFTQEDALKIHHYLQDRTRLLRDGDNLEAKRMEQRLVLPGRQWLQYMIGDHYDGKTPLWYR